jgi:hypothetical protein
MTLNYSIMTLITFLVLIPNINNTLVYDQPVLCVLELKEEQKVHGHVSLYTLVTMTSLPKHVGIDIRH